MYVYIMKKICVKHVDQKNDIMSIVYLKIKNIYKMQIDDVNSSINELKNRLNEITILKKKLRLDGKIKQINKNNIALL